MWIAVDIATCRGDGESDPDALYTGICLSSASTIAPLHIPGRCARVPSKSHNTTPVISTKIYSFAGQKVHFQYERPRVMARYGPALVRHSPEI